MEQSKSIVFRAWIQRPKVILIITGCFILLVNAVFFSWKTLPDYLGRVEAKEQYSNIRNTLDGIGNVAEAEQVTEDKISKLVAEIPLVLPIDEVIVQLTGFAEETGIFINSLKQVDGSSSDGGLEETIEQLSQSESPVVNNAPVSDNATPTPVGANFKEFDFELEIFGELPGLLNFFDRLAANATMTSVKHWGLFELPEETVNKITVLDSTRDNFRLTLTFAMYTMPGYAEVFGDQGRKDTSIDQVLKDLQLKYPGIKPFQSVRKDEGEN